MRKADKCSATNFSVTVTVTSGWETGRGAGTGTLAAQTSFSTHFPELDNFDPYDLPDAGLLCEERKLIWDLREVASG